MQRYGKRLDGRNSYAHKRECKRNIRNRHFAYARIGLKGGEMKHKKEWCTCDRCGAEIGENERSMFLKKVYRISGLLVRKYAYEKVNAFDLCPKCRKDFERFMRNEENKK